DEIAVDLSSLAFSAGEPVPAEVTVSLDGEQVGTAAVDATPVDGTDQIGQAQVRVQVPEGLSGTVELTVSDENGTTVSVPVTIADGGGEPGPGDSLWDYVLELIGKIWDFLLRILFP